MTKGYWLPAHWIIPQSFGLTIMMRIEQVSEPLIHENPVPFCSFHSLSDDYVLTIAQNGIVRIWDYKRGSVILGPYSSGDVTSSPVHNGVFINQGKGLINFQSDSNALRIFNITKIDEEQGAFQTGTINRYC
ncbi:MAG: hypothetical protein ACJZ70_10110 [Limisphaerales bacterium]